MLAAAALRPRTPYAARGVEPQASRPQADALLTRFTLALDRSSPPPPTRSRRSRSAWPRCALTQPRPSGHRRRPRSPRWTRAARRSARCARCSRPAPSRGSSACATCCSPCAAAAWARVRSCWSTAPSRPCSRRLGLGLELGSGSGLGLGLGLGFHRHHALPPVLAQLRALVAGEVAPGGGPVGGAEEPSRAQRRAAAEVSDSSDLDSSDEEEDSHRSP